MTFILTLAILFHYCVDIFLGIAFIVRLVSTMPVTYCSPLRRYAKHTLVAMTCLSDNSAYRLCNMDLHSDITILLVLWLTWYAEHTLFCIILT